MIIEIVIAQAVLLVLAMVVTVHGSFREKKATELRDKLIDGLLRLKDALMEQNDLLKEENRLLKEHIKG